MSPRLEQGISIKQLVLKAGGSPYSARFPRIDVKYTKIFVVFRKMWLEGYGFINVSGGGELARIHETDSN